MREPTRSEEVLVPTANTSRMQRDYDRVEHGREDSAFSIVNSAERTSLNKGSGVILTTALL